MIAVLFVSVSSVTAATIDFGGLPPPPPPPLAAPGNEFRLKKLQGANQLLCGASCFGATKLDEGLLGAPALFIACLSLDKNPLKKEWLLSDASLEVDDQLRCTDS